MEIVKINAVDIPDAWFQCISKVLDSGFKYEIQHGSFIGQTRLEFDFIVINIKNAYKEPYDLMLPKIPPHLNIPDPVANGYVEQYLPYLMTGEKTEGEDYCYDKETEILTNEGWKKFKDLNRKETIATLNPATSEIVYQKPIDYVNFDYEGEVYLCDNRYINFCVNNGHKLFTIPTNYHTKNKDFKLIPIDNTLNYKMLKFKCDGVWVGKRKDFFTFKGVSYNNPRYKEVNNKELKLDINEWLYIFGVWLAEGSIRKYKNKKQYSIVITISNENDRMYIIDKLNKMGLRASSYEKDIIFNDKRIWTYLKQFGLASEKFIPEDIKLLSKEHLINLYKGMMFGDGDKTGHRYTTNSKQLSDDFSEICLKIGKVAKVSYDTYQSTSGFKNNGVYRIYISTKYVTPCIENNIKKVNYKDKLYCVKVPNYHIIYVRRNGKPHWSGNTYGERLVSTPVPAFPRCGATDSGRGGWCSFHSVQGINQIEHWIKVLRETPNTNQAVLQVAQPSDCLLNDPPCLNGESLILTIDGMKKIKDIKIGDVVLTHKGNWKPVVDIGKKFYNGKINKISLKGYNEKLYITPTHELYGTNIKLCPYKNVGNLKCKINCKRQKKFKNGCKSLYKKYKKEWIESQYCDENFYNILPKIKENIYCPFTKNEMWLFGLFLADGDYLKEDGIRFNLGSHEKELIDKTIKICKEIYKLDPHVSYSNKNDSCTRISFYSRKLYKKYIKMFNKLAKNKTLPMDFVFYKEKYIKCVINGYNSGDGYNRKRGNQEQFSLYTSSLDLKNKFLLMLNKINIIPSVTKIYPKDSYIEGRLIKSNGPGWNISYKFKDIKNQYYWKNNSYLFVPISKNEQVDFNDYVYNISVKDDNSYIANGITVKNCLRQIDMRIKENKLFFYPYFRSWDLWGGFPANLAGIAVLQKFMADEIGVEIGPIIASSKGLHIYGYVEELAKIRTNKTNDRSKEK